jgi:hypothetical protein
VAQAMHSDAKQVNWLYEYKHNGISISQIAVDNFAGVDIVCAHQALYVVCIDGSAANAELKVRNNIKLIQAGSLMTYPNICAVVNFASADVQARLQSVFRGFIKNFYVKDEAPAIFQLCASLLPAVQSE